MLVSLAQRTPVLAGADQMTFVDIDSLLRRVYGHQKRGARFGPAKVGGYQLLPAWVVGRWWSRSPPGWRRRWSPRCAPRGGNAGSARGAASLLTHALVTAKAAGATGMILVRADSPLLRRCGHQRRSACGGDVLGSPWWPTAAIRAAIATISQDAWVAVRYPGAVHDRRYRRVDL
jgi:hypothetical protein